MFNMQQIALAYLAIRGFSIGIIDLTLTLKSDRMISKTTRRLLEEGKVHTDRLIHNNIIPPLGMSVTDYYEATMMATLTNDYLEPMMSGIAQDNSIFYLAAIKSTGNLTLFAQINALYGQRKIGAKRLPQMLSYKRSNPFYPRFDTNPVSRGFIDIPLKQGMKPSHFISGTQESRLAIINKTMLTATTGAQSRVNVKNLESIIVTNVGLCETATYIVEQAFGDTGFDPRYLETVNFHYMILSDAEFEKKFNFDPVEYAMIKQDRQMYRNTFLRIEKLSTSQPFGTTQLLPINAQRIVDDALYEVVDATGLKISTSSDEDLSTMRKMVRDFCEYLPYVYYNEKWQEDKRYVAPYYTHGLRLICVNIRATLYTEMLKKLNVELLNAILLKIHVKLSESLLDYGTTIGVITALSVSEPSTQLTLHSIRADVRTRISKKSPIQTFKEIVCVVPLHKAVDASMMMQMQPGTTFEVARRIANNIEMLNFGDFVVGWQLFYEKYGQIVHPTYIHEQKIISDFERVPVNKPPTDLLHWCIRFELNMYDMILNNMTIETIIINLYKNLPDMHFVYTSDNDAEALIIRGYIRSIANTSNLKDIIERAEKMLTVKVRGVQGVISAYVDTSTKINDIKPDGSIESESIFMIKTNGVNMMGIFALQDTFPEIDYRTLQTDHVRTTEQIYGVGAAKNTIISGIMAVLPGLYYGHYNLIASLMTVTGKCTTISNSGPDQRCDNQLLKMSHCKPIKIIENLLIKGDNVPITGISPHLIVGGVPHIGSYYNDICVNVDFVKANLKTVEELLEDI
jgi:hypothetical protein